VNEEALAHWGLFPQKKQTNKDHFGDPSLGYIKNNIKVHLNDKKVNRN
jgi:hypothetical protein